MKMRLRSALLLSAFLCTPLQVMAQTYTYDNLGRVSSVVQPNGAKTVYYYDNVDNRTATQTATSGTTTITPPANSPSVIIVTSASNLNTLASNAGYVISSTSNFLFVVPSNATIAGAPGAAGYGINTGTWPTGATISLVVNGKLYGGGGTGGNGTCSATFATAGVPGEDALYVSYPITVIVNSGGVIGGGGGGGGGASVYGMGNGHGGGGGSCGADGGGGFPNGLGGLGSTPPSGFSASATTSGSPGTLSGGGAGGTGGLPGGGGAGANGIPGATGNGSAGGNGGAGGYAIRKNGNAVSTSGSGTITGTVG